MQRLTELAVAEDDRLEAEPIPTVLGATMRPVIAELKVFHAQAAGALREAAADHDSKAFVYLLRMQREKPKLDRLFDGVGLRACGSEQ